MGRSKMKSEGLRPPGVDKGIRWAEKQYGTCCVAPTLWGRRCPGSVGRLVPCMQEALHSLVAAVSGLMLVEGLSSSSRAHKQSEMLHLPFLLVSKPLGV